MDAAENKGNWEEQKSKLKKKFETLTGSSQMFAEGTKEATLGKLMVALGKTREELNNIISGL